jgi:hypothetical protein
MEKRRNTMSFNVKLEVGDTFTGFTVRDKIDGEVIVTKDTVKACELIFDTSSTDEGINSKGKIIVSAVDSASKPVEYTYTLPDDFDAALKLYFPPQGCHMAMPRDFDEVLKHIERIHEILKHFDRRIEEQLQGFDSRIKQLEEKPLRATPARGSVKGSGQEQSKS